MDIICLMEMGATLVRRLSFFSKKLHELQSTEASDQVAALVISNAKCAIDVTQAGGA
jgi:hypothetical protein